MKKIISFIILACSGMSNAPESLVKGIMFQAEMAFPRQPYRDLSAGIKKGPAPFYI